MRVDWNQEGAQSRCWVLPVPGVSGETVHMQEQSEANEDEAKRNVYKLLPY